jgi:hypothetical protein
LAKLSSSSSFIVYFSFRLFTAGSPRKLSSSSSYLVYFSFRPFAAGSLRQSCPAHNRPSYIIRLVFSSLDRHTKLSSSLIDRLFCHCVFFC